MGEWDIGGGASEGYGRAACEQKVSQNVCVIVVLDAKRWMSSLRKPSS